MKFQIDSAMSMTPYSDEFMEAKVNNIYRGDPSQGAAGVFVNLTLKVFFFYFQNKVKVISYFALQSVRVSVHSPLEN